MQNFRFALWVVCGSFVMAKGEGGCLMSVSSHQRNVKYKKCRNSRYRSLHWEDRLDCGCFRMIAYFWRCKSTNQSLKINNRKRPIKGIGLNNPLQDCISTLNKLIMTVWLIVETYAFTWSFVQISSSVWLIFISTVQETDRGARRKV